MVRTFEYRRFTKKEVTFWNTFIGRCYGVSFSWLDEKCRLIFDRAPEVPDAGHDWFAKVLIDEAPVLAWFSCSDEFLKMCLKKLVGEDPFGDGVGVPLEVSEAVVNVLFEDVADRIGALAGKKCEIEEIKPLSGNEADKQSRMDEGNEYSFDFKVMVEEPQRVCLSGRVFLNDVGLDVVSQIFEGIGTECTTDFVENIPVFIGIVAGRTSLSVNELYSVQPNDIILMSECYGSGVGKYLLWLSRDFQMWAVVENETVTITGKKEMVMADEETKGTDQSEGQEENTQDEPIVPVEEVPVELRFEVGKKVLTVGELKSIRPGYTFELDVPVTRIVSIYANNRRIGTGELVQIDDRVGVRVVELEGHDATS